MVAAAVLVGVVGGVGLFLGGRAIRRSPDRRSIDVIADSAAWSQASRFDVAREDRPARGRADAPVTIVEFTDYECPFCRRHATETLPSLLDRHGDRIRYMVRNFPIPALHAHAVVAARAVECAHQQDGFWEYRNALLRETGALTVERVRAHAVATGLDEGVFARCLDDRTTRAMVAQDLLDGWEHGVTGTPTFFINGRRFRGARSLEELERYIELALRVDSP